MPVFNLTPTSDVIASIGVTPNLPSGITVSGASTRSVRLLGTSGLFYDTNTELSVTAMNGQTTKKNFRLIVQTQAATASNFAVNKSGSDAVLTWTLNSNTAQYIRIYRSLSDTGVINSGNLVATLTAREQTWTDVGVGANKYYYAISVVAGLLHNDTAVVTWPDPSYNDQMAALAPIAWWKMDETNVSDNAPATNLGTVAMNGQYSNSAGTVARGAIVRKGSLGGVQVTGNGSSYFKCFYSSNLPILNALNQGQSFTTMFWFRPTSVGGGLLLQVWGGSGGGRLNIYNTGANHPANTGRFTYASPALNTPHFMCLIKDVAAGTYRMMVDGVWLTPATAYSDLAIAGNDQMAIAGRATNSPTGMAGVYSDLAFFNKALTTAQVDALYLAGKL